MKSGWRWGGGFGFLGYPNISMKSDEVIRILDDIAFQFHPILLTHAAKRRMWKKFLLSCSDRMASNALQTERFQTFYFNR